MQFCFSLVTLVHLQTKVAHMLDALSLRVKCGLQLNPSMQDQLVGKISHPHYMVEMIVLMRMNIVPPGLPWENVKRILCT